MTAGKRKALTLMLITCAALLAAASPAMAEDDRSGEGALILAEPYQAPPGPKVPEAERLYRAGKGFEAIELLKGVVAREPSNAPAWVQLVELELEAGEIKEAWNHARRAAEACPDDSRVWAMKAIARGYKAILSLHHLNFFGLAGVRDVIHSFDRAIELNPLDVRTRLMRFEVASSGRLLSGVGRDELEEEAAHLEAIEPAAAAYARAMMLGWDDEDEEAARLLDGLVKRRPGDPKAWLARARHLTDWGLDEPERAREAVESLRKAEELGMGRATAFERCRR